MRARDGRGQRRSALSDTPTEPELVGKHLRALGDLTRGLYPGRARLADNAEHLAACRRIDSGC